MKRSDNLFQAWVFMALAVVATLVTALLLALIRCS
jgi:hypothetical protein